MLSPFTQVKIMGFLGVYELVRNFFDILPP